MSSASLRIVFDHLHDRGASDIPAIAARLHPDVVHQGVEPEQVCHNREEVLARIAQAGEGDLGIERLELVDGARGRVAVGLAGPRFLRVPWLTAGQLYIVYTVRDGLIVRMDDHRTRAEALAAAGAGPADWA